MEASLTKCNMKIQCDLSGQRLHFDYILLTDLVVQGVCLSMLGQQQIWQNWYGI